MTVVNARAPRYTGSGNRSPSRRRCIQGLRRIRAARSRRPPAAIYQEVANVAGARAGDVRLGRAPLGRCALPRPPTSATSFSDRELLLAISSTTCRYRSRVAKSIAGYTPAGSVRRVASTTLTRFDELSPVRRAEEPQAPDAVADRDLGRRLILAGQLKYLVDRLTLLGDPMLEPRHRNTQRRSSRLDSAGQLGDERGCGRRGLSDQVRQHQHDARGLLGRRPRSSDRPTGRPGPVHAVRPVTVADTRRRFSRRASRSMIGIAQSSPSRSGVTALIGCDERPSAFDIDAPVGVGDELDRDVVDPWISTGRGVDQPGELSVVAAG